MIEQKVLSNKFFIIFFEGMIIKKLFLITWMFSSTLLLFWCSSNTTSVDDSGQNIESALVQPERRLDLYGKIISMEGNEFSIQEVDTTKDPTFGMEQTEKKAYMATLSEDQRMAMKAEARSAVLWEVKIIIPVWIPISVKTEQWVDAVSKMGSLEDMSPGSYISIRYNSALPDQKIAEYVKKSFTK